MPAFTRMHATRCVVHLLLFGQLPATAGTIGMVEYRCRFWLKEVILFIQNMFKVFDVLIGMFG